MIVVFADSTTLPWINTLGYGTLLGVLELWRRWCWSLLKIENEQLHNFEKYRDVQEIPYYDDVIEDAQVEENQYSKMVQTVLTQIKGQKSVETPN